MARKKITEKLPDKEWRPEGLSPLPNCGGCRIKLCTTEDTPGNRLRCRQHMVEWGFIKYEPS